MKNILMVSFSWIPCGSVGIIRMARFAKYLIRFGYGVSVLACPDQKGNINWDIEERELNKVRVYRLVSEKRKSFFTFLQEKINPQLEIDWFYSLRKKLDKLLEDIKCDVILSSSPPESVHFVAKAIKKKIKKPWIADLRDLWSHDHYRGFGLIRRAVLGLEEKNILKRADRILTVSDKWATFLKKRYGKRVRVITNSFDEDWYNTPFHRTADKFKISYLGKLNAYHQDITIFLQCIRDIVERGEIARENLEVNFYISGYGKPNIKKLAVNMGLDKIVHEYKPVPLKEAINIIRDSSLLLVVGWRGLSASGWRPQKVYEYLGSGVPILLINNMGNEELTKLVLSTENGNTANKSGDIRRVILRYYDEFTTKGIRANNQHKTPVSEYTAYNVTKKLCQIIEELRV